MKLKVEAKNLSLKMKVEKGEFNPPFDLEFSLEELAYELEGETKEIGDLIKSIIGALVGGTSHEPR